jgi:ParB/RepB/Spo0J family partition protein
VQETESVQQGETMNAVLQTLPLGQLLPSSSHAQSMRRKSFNKAALSELAESVRAHGLLQPIVVRPRHEEKVGGVTVGAHFEIVAGERRFLAARIAELAEVPVSVRDLSDEQVIEIQLIENLQREDVHPMLEAEGYHELVHTYGHPIEDVYSKVGKSRSYVYGRMKLLALSKKAREAFYSNEISASIANLIARIPIEKLQDEALEAVRGNPDAKQPWQRRPPLSFREAAAHINDHFMLDLGSAPFPTDDETLNGKAGACGRCPKRTGNQPELFADAKSGDICTDTACFSAKARAWGQRRVEAARKDGREVIVGPEAKKIAPNGLGDRGWLTGGYHRSDEKTYNGSNHVAVKKLVKSGEQPALLVDGDGNVAELYHDRQLKKPERSSSSSAGSGDRAHRQAVAAAQRETKARVAIFNAVRAKLKPLSKRQVAELVALAVDSEGWEQVRRLEAAESGVKFDRFREPDYRSASDQVERLKLDSELDSFIAEVWLIAELKASSYRHTKPIRLEAAAKAAGVDVAKIRRALAPKTKKKAKKKSGKKAR